MSLFEMKVKGSSSDLENSSISEKSSINLSKISSHEATFLRNDESTSSTLMIEALLGRKAAPKLFDMKENLRPPNRAASARNKSQAKGPHVKKVLIDLRGEEPSSHESSLHCSLQSCLQTAHTRSKKHSHASSAAQLRPEEATNVKVFARMKPADLEETLQRECMFELHPTSVSIDGAVYTFDQMFSDSATQEQVFGSVAEPTVRDIFEGYNGTIFAYGQTGSGKTYTMFGSEHNKGIIPRTVERIFSLIQERPSIKCKITASMLEIYKESLSDLFSLQKSDLKIKESQEGIYVEGLTELEVHNSKSLLGLVDFGEQIRKVSSTRVNQYSSRSHTMIMICIRTQDDEGHTKSGKLYLVDLAGSEKVRRSGASGETLEEAKKINLSLSCLGNVINALTCKKRRDHIPYRESKLTRILQDSLSGNCKTSIIVNFSGAQHCIQQTISALKFAQRAKKIRNLIKINGSQRESVDSLYAIISDLQRELQLTKHELQRYKELEQEQPEVEVPSARLVIPSERANVEASLHNYRSRATLRPLKMSMNLEELSSLNASGSYRVNSTLHSPSLSSLSLNRSSAMSNKDISLNFSIKNDELSESASVRLDMAEQPLCFNPFRK